VVLVNVIEEEYHEDVEMVQGILILEEYLGESWTLNFPADHYTSYLRIGIVETLVVEMSIVEAFDPSENRPQILIPVELELHIVVSSVPFLQQNEPVVELQEYFFGYHRQEGD